MLMRGKRTAYSLLLHRPRDEVSPTSWKASAWVYGKQRTPSPCAMKKRAGSGPRWSTSRVPCLCESENYRIRCDSSVEVVCVRSRRPRAINQSEARRPQTRKKSVCIAYPIATRLWWLPCPIPIQVLCLSGASPARPHQAWLQEGTPSSKLRLQVRLSFAAFRVTACCRVTCSLGQAPIAPLPRSNSQEGWLSEKRHCSM